jgi:hypothetical protein
VLPPVEAAVQTVITGDGRRLVVSVHGPERGPALIAHSGTPDDGSLHRETLERGAARGLRQVSCARPGYAGSDRNQGRSVADRVIAAATVAGAARHDGDGLSRHRYGDVLDELLSAGD